jgi:hypothetical protein
MFWPGTGVKHARNIEIIATFGNLISVFLMFQACFRAEHWSMPAVLCSTHKIIYISAIYYLTSIRKCK